MAIIGKKPRGIQVQIKDIGNNISKSFTVYDITFEKLYYNLMFFATQLVEYDEVKLLCYTGGKTHEKKIEQR